ncbi:MAG: hypothetical protein RL227_1949, partial [Pseudomonadota bacterium]
MSRTSEGPLLQVRGLTKRFDVSAPWLNRVIERLPRAMSKLTSST